MTSAYQDVHIDLIAEIRARAEAAAPGPWHVNHMGELRAPSPYNGQLMGTWANGPAGAEADFIAHAREDIPFLLAEVSALRKVIEKAKALHKPMVPNPHFPEYKTCGYCEFSGWPCATVRILASAPAVASPETVGDN